MHRQSPSRVRSLKSIGVNEMGRIADEAAQRSADSGVSQEKWLRLENLDVNIPPIPAVTNVTALAASNDDDNSYLPFIGQRELRDAAAAHVTKMTGGVVNYTGERNCIVSTGGLSGILNTLLATVETGDGVLMTDPTYIGLINRVKLIGAVPKLVPFDFQPGGSWKLNRQRLQQLIDSRQPRITTMLLMSPSMPSGAYLNIDDWMLIAELCVKNEILLILDSAMERLLFDDREVIHPASLPGMAERTITIGSSAKELRMIGWRVGWIVGPEQFMPDIATVSMANVVVPVGIAQKAVMEALNHSYDDIPGYVRELQARRDLVVQELQGLPVGIPAGGWSLLVRVDSLGWTGKQASQALLHQGVCVTAMDGWGDEHGSQYIRLVFSNATCEDLKGLGRKVRKALRIE